MGLVQVLGKSADAVQGMAEESAAAMVEMDRAIQEVGQHVSEASQLTEQVASGAEAGSLAVSTTIDGIAEIRRQTLASKTALEKLTARISEISTPSPELSMNSTSVKSSAIDW